MLVLIKSIQHFIKLQLKFILSFQTILKLLLKETLHFIVLLKLSVHNVVVLITLGLDHLFETLNFCLQWWYNSFFNYFYFIWRPQRFIQHFLWFGLWFRLQMEWIQLVHLFFKFIVSLLVIDVLLLIFFDGFLQLFNFFIKTYSYCVILFFHLNFMVKYLQTNYFSINRYFITLQINLSVFNKSINKHLLIFIILFEFFILFLQIIVFFL